MLRTFVCAVLALAICTIGLLAGEIKGKVKKLSFKKGEAPAIVVTVGDNDKEVTLDKKWRLKDASGTEITDKAERKKAIKELKGKDVVITTETKEGKEVGTEIKLAK